MAKKSKNNNNKNVTNEDDFSPIVKEALLKIIEKTHPIQYFKTDIFDEVGYSLCFKGKKNLICECDYSPIKDRKDKNFSFKVALHLSNKSDDIYMINYYLPSFKTKNGYNICGYVTMAGKSYRDESCFCFDLENHSRQINQYFTSIISDNFIGCTVELAKQKPKEESLLFQGFNLDKEEQYEQTYLKGKITNKKLPVGIPSINKLSKMVKLM